MRSWNGSIERLNFCGFLLSTQEGVFPNDRDQIRSFAETAAVLKAKVKYSRQRECNEWTQYSISQLFLTSFGTSCPKCHKIPRNEEWVEDHPNQKLAHFIFSSNVDLPTKPSAFQFPVIIFLTSNDDRVWQSADVFSTALLLLLHL